MIEHFTIEKILALNPQIDKKDPEEIQKILRGMRGSKKSRHRRNLIPPYARHRVTIGGDDSVDPRAVILRQTKR